MQIAECEIHRLTESVWASALELEVKPDVASEPDQDDLLTGCVNISGAWQGAVVLKCPVPLAQQVAARMFGSAVSSEEIRDALGELTNITGGNVKSLVPGPSYLSLPVVADGADHSLRVPESRLVGQASFRCQGHPFVVSVLEHDPTGRNTGAQPMLLK